MFDNIGRNISQLFDISEQLKIKYVHFLHILIKDKGLVVKKYLTTITNGIHCNILIISVI